MTSNKNSFFSNQGTASTIIAQIPPKLAQITLTCPKRTKSTHDFQKNVFSFIFGTIFTKSKLIQQFCEGLHIFCQSFLRFCPEHKGFRPDSVRYNKRKKKGFAKSFITTYKAVFLALGWLEFLRELS